MLTQCHLSGAGDIVGKNGNFEAVRQMKLLEYGFMLRLGSKTDWR
jgi:hypothetical protein